MPRHVANYGIVAADAVQLFELVEATLRADHPLLQFVTAMPSQATPEAARYTAFTEIRRRFAQAGRRHDMPAIGAFVVEKKFHDERRAGLHLHALGAMPRRLAEPLLRSLTGAAVERVGQGKWQADNGRLNVRIQPNLGPDGIFNRALYMLKERSEDYETRLIDDGMIDPLWGKVYPIEVPAPINCPRLLLSNDALQLVLRDRESRPTIYLLPEMPEPQACEISYPFDLEGQGGLFDALSDTLPPDKAQATRRHREKIAPAPMLRLFSLVGNVDVLETMRRLGPTHEAIAERLGISRPQATNILNGQFSPSRAVVQRVLELAKAA